MLTIYRNAMIGARLIPALTGNAFSMIGSNMRAAVDPRAYGECFAVNTESDFMAG